MSKLYGSDVVFIDACCINHTSKITNISNGSLIKANDKALSACSG